MPTVAASIIAILCCVAREGKTVIPVGEQICGLHSFAVVADRLGKDIPWTELVRALDPDDAPFNIAELSMAAKTIGFESYGVQWRVRSQAEFGCPAILLIRRTRDSNSPDHFIASLGRKGDKLCVCDFPRKPKLVPIKHVMKYWDGTALYIDHRNGSVIPPMRRRHRMVNAAQVILVLIGCVALVFFVRSSLRQRRAEASAR